MKPGQNKIQLLALTGVMAALITVFTAWFVHIPVGINGGYVHLGDALIYIAAAILPAPYAMAAGAIGGGMADLLTAPMWTGATVIIKMLIVLPFTSKNTKILCGRNLLAPVISFFISATGYYIADIVLFGAPAAIIASFLGSFAQSGGSALFFYALAVAFDKANLKSMITGRRVRVSARPEGGLKRGEDENNG